MLRSYLTLTLLREEKNEQCPIQLLQDDNLRHLQLMLGKLHQAQVLCSANRIVYENSYNV